MTTPVWLTGFEHGVLPNSNGGGLSSAKGTDATSPSVVTTPVHSGIYSLKILAGGVTSAYNRRNLDASQQIGVFRAYLYIPTGGLPNGDWSIFGFNTAALGAVQDIEMNTSGALKISLSGGSAITSSALSLDVWHLIEGRLDITSVLWTMDWKIDGIDQTQAVSGVQLNNDSLSYFRIGDSSTSVTGTCYVDDVVVSVTYADYPIGEGKTELLLPTSDGTHNTGINIMEDQAGADIGAVPAWNLIDDVPMTGIATYIRQLSIATGSYAEVLFGDLQANPSAIIGAAGLLCYTAQSTLADTGGCILSKDGFSTWTTLWGEAGALADYSDGGLGNLFYKVAILANVNDLTTVNALKARMGYSDDASPDPYWVNLAVEVAYVQVAATARKFQKTSVLGA